MQKTETGIKIAYALSLLKKTTNTQKNIQTIYS